MTQNEPLWALGLMSGTSLDGVDGAMVLTDGVEILEFGPSAFRPYTEAETETLRMALGLWPEDPSGRLQPAFEVIQRAHREMIGEFEDVALVGFHGQTLAHDPDHGRTFQMGDGAAIARATGTPVVWDFRTQDMQRGGEGAPLAPFFHFACAKYLKADAPQAFLNLGGVGNVTWVDPSCEKPEDPSALLAFDTGPANAPVNDLMMQRLGQPFDEDGRLAAAGTVHEDIVSRIYQREYFGRKPPKSLDRDDFSDAITLVSHLSDADAAATLTALSAACVALGQNWLPSPPERWLVSGGGQRNPVFLKELTKRLDQPVQMLDSTGLDGDMLEAQAFAYLAVRVARGWPTSAPQTTGCDAPVSGGRVSVPE